MTPLAAVAMSHAIAGSPEGGEETGWVASHRSTASPAAAARRCGGHQGRELGRTAAAASCRLSGLGLFTASLTHDPVCCRGDAVCRPPADAACGHGDVTRRWCHCSWSGDTSQTTPRATKRCRRKPAPEWRRGGRATAFGC
ncbi:hypothetical protein ACP70R_004026 [Stipagrostis hirtigluma subsp. patula]